jgi:serine phosphatase RsbU (regulator of sigma subunit)
MTLRAYLADGREPADAVTGLDQLMKTLPQPQMATLFHLNLDLEAGRASFVRAGHPPALLRRTDGEIVDLGGDGSPPLGLVEGATFGSAEAELPPGSMLLLYTDGLIERRDVDLVEGLERLRLALATAPDDPEAVVNELPAALDAEQVPDDIALLALRVED